MTKSSRGNPYILLILAGICLVLAAISFYLPQFTADVIDQTESPYQSIYISESDGIRMMHVGSLRDRTSAMDIDDPYRHIYEYTAIMMVALGYVENPQRFLVVGLGGGTMTRTIRKFYPDAEIVNIEFDPEIVRMARKYFEYTDDGDMKLVVQDGRRWLRNTSETFDVIFLDAFHGGYIPFHLTTREFLTIVKEHLAPGGVVCSNTWTNQELADRESATYHAVFGDFHHYLGERSTNRILIATLDALPSPETVQARLSRLDSELNPEHLDLSALFDNHFAPDPSWPEGTNVLTDDHAPVNLLKNRS